MYTGPSSFDDAAPSEAARLRDVYALRLLDTQREERFDRFTELLVDLFDVPIAFVSLIAENRQWFKAISGSDMRQVDRKESFCAQTVSQDRTLVIEDLTRDAQFSGNPLVSAAPGLRFYAGVPIHGPSGYPVGTVGLLDFRARGFGPRPRRHLERIGALVDHELLHGCQIDELRQELQHVAYYDVLTGLPNQRLVIDRLEFALDLALQQKKRVFYALLDLQDFGNINQAHGWQAGNELLRAVGARLSERYSKPCVVARWHGDQFVVLHPMAEAEADPLQFAGDVAGCLAAAFRLRDREVYLNIRVGVSVAPDHGSNAFALLRRAHAAMRAAGRNGKSNYRLYSPALEEAAVRQQGVAERLREALHREQIQLAYQPLQDLQSRCYCGAEALLRWDDPELGYVPPEELIAVAQRVGLQEHLELSILRRACTDAVNWQAMGSAIPVAVNLSAIQLHQHDLVEHVKAVLADTGLPPEALILEVTEQSMIVDLEGAIASMQALSDHGVRLAIDDFGTGYSSFAYLADLPVHALKIDRRFIAGLGRGGNAARVVTGIIQLAHTLGLRVVAEGVECEEQVEFLRRADCDEVQGFFLSRPLSAERLPAAMADLR